MRFAKESKTGYRFSIKAAGSKAPLPGTTITILPGNIQLYIYKNGVAKTELAKDVFYTYTILIPGYLSIIKINRPVNPGVMSRINVSLTHAASFA